MYYRGEEGGERVGVRREGGNEKRVSWAGMGGRNVHVKECISTNCGLVRCTIGVGRERDKDRGKE